ncbi:hypothetical protein ACIG87_21080 [Micromonospora sp. NPDC051925]|uniref:hypothetical protein n=1 Tax=Micromonospora sp. NPDC051925 TaxID=3364288 RepID=UPI0037C98AA8
MSEPVSTLVAALPADAPVSHLKRARDLMLRAEATETSIERHPDRCGTRGWFASAADATRAALELLSPPPDLAGDPPRFRVLVDTAAAPGSGRPDRLTPLLARTDAGQILVTAATAIVAGATLPPGAQLYYHGRWRPAADGPPEQLYELRPPNDDAEAEADNLHWARRALAGPRPAPTPASARALAALRDGWRQVLSGELVTHVLTAATPSIPGNVSAELALRLHTEGARILYGRWEREPQDEFQALREALGVYLGGRTAEALRTEIDGRVDHISRLLPEVVPRLGLPPRPPMEVERTESFEAIEAWLDAMARQRPTLIVLHDLPPADLLSARLLGHLRLTCRRSRIMLVVTTTSRAPAPALDELLDQAGPGEDANLRHHRLD